MRLLLAIVVMITLAGCGFYLRGDMPLPPAMERVYIDTPVSSPLRYELESQLLAAGAEVVEQKAAATTLLVVRSATIRSRILSLDVLGRASEYGLTLSVKYSLQTENGVIMDQPLSSRVERDFRVDPDDVLGRGAEQGMVEREMYSIAAAQMMRRLRSAAVSSRAYLPPRQDEASPAQ